MTVDSSTSITVTTPSVPSADLTYYVVVTTAPGGTSGNGPVFTFQPLTPVVASVSPNSGAGAQNVTITGIGFVNAGTTVTLVPTGRTSTLTATNVSVQGSTLLTATLPSRSSGTYYVEVTTTTGGNSGQGGVANEYTY